MPKLSSCNIIRTSMQCIDPAYILETLQKTAPTKEFNHAPHPCSVPVQMFKLLHNILQAAIQNTNK